MSLWPNVECMRCLHVFAVHSGAIWHNIANAGIRKGFKSVFLSSGIQFDLWRVKHCIAKIGYCNLALSLSLVKYSLWQMSTVVRHRRPPLSYLYDTVTKNVYL